MILIIILLGARALLGLHECLWCGDDYGATHNGKSVTVGALNLFVPGEGFLHALAGGARHPGARLRAALRVSRGGGRCPAMRSRASFAAIAECGSGRFAASVRKRHLAEA